MQDVRPQDENELPPLRPERFRNGAGCSMYPYAQNMNARLACRTITCIIVIITIVACSGRPRGGAARPVAAAANTASARCSAGRTSGRIRACDGDEYEDGCRSNVCAAVRPAADALWTRVVGAAGSRCPWPRGRASERNTRDGRRGRGNDGRRVLERTPEHRPRARPTPPPPPRSRFVYGYVTWSASV